MLWVNQKRMDEFGYTVPTTWQEWAALGEKVAAEHPGYIIGNIGRLLQPLDLPVGQPVPAPAVDGDT